MHGVGDLRSVTSRAGRTLVSISVRDASVITTAIAEHGGFNTQRSPTLAAQFVCGEVSLR